MGGRESGYAGHPQSDFASTLDAHLFPGDALLVVDAENMPCPGEVIQQHYPDVPKLVQRFPKAAMHKRSVVGWVEREGYIAEGDTV